MSLKHNLDAIEEYAETIIQQFSPRERKKLLRQMAMVLRENNQKRITAQQDPDGTAWQKRKPHIQKRGNTVKKKRKMFTGLRAAKRMKISATDNRLTVGYTGRNARIARVTQYGLRDRVSKNGPSVKYAMRQLLGMNGDDAKKLNELILNHAAKEL